MRTIKINIIIWLFLLICLSQLSGQTIKDYKQSYYLHTLADTSLNPSYKKFINFWIDFLYTEKDSMRRIYWNPNDIKRWGNEYSLFYYGFSQYPLFQLLKYFNPYILSVYNNNEFCQITTAFWNFKFTPSDSSAKLNSNPFCIVDVGIYEKNGHLYLTNLFDRRTAGWEKFSLGKINYIVEPTLKPDYKQAKEAVSFTDSLSRLFNSQYDSITYVVCSTPNELGYLIGFDFFFTGFTNGKTYHEGRTILSGLGTFYYPHELAHLIIDPILKVGKFYGEGLTTYFGGSGNKSYIQLLPEFKKNYPIITDSIFFEILKYPNSPSAYTLGALVVEYIYRNQGINGLKKLSIKKSDAIDFINYLCEMNGIKKDTLFKEINKRLNLIEIK